MPRSEAALRTVPAAHAGLPRRAAVVVAGLAALLADPRAATACAVCFGGKGDDWTSGFVLGTWVMLLLPPAIVVFAGVTIYRAMKRQEARLRERDMQRDAERGAPVEA